MLKRVLVRELIEDGERLLAELRRSGFPVKAAFWVDVPESHYWPLVMATPVVDEGGPDVAYRSLRDALNAIQIQELALDDIFVVSPLGDDYRDYRAVLRGGGRLGGEALRAIRLASFSRTPTSIRFLTSRGVP